MASKQSTNTPAGRQGPDSSRPDHRALLKTALETVERMRSKLEGAERARTEPIAVIGMSCRFPGGADSPEEYWKLLCERRDAIQEPPADRWVRAASAGLNAEAAAMMPRQFGGFVEGIDQFDSGLFGIAPREVVTMDPQQRLLLEVSWEAVERAGYAPDRLVGSPTGVFIGITANDYAQVVREADPDRLDGYYATGNGNSVAAGRISYVLGLRGPAMSVDTACSSSLTAIHLACQSLRLGECNMALAGGVNAILIPDTFIYLAKWGMMAPDGHCKAFDASADGFVRSEGCGVLALKRLSQAVAERDPILAIIRGSAANQDGASSGLTVPNGIAQQAVIKQALASAGLTAHDIDYIESHGTGTSLGDPIELEGIDAVMGEGRSRELIVGSVKSNIGHLESAAGVAGLMKVVLALQHEEIPANLHFKNLNPRITLQRLKVVVPTEQLAWRTQGKARRAGVSSFGFSGTNVHVVLEEAPLVEKPAEIEKPAEAPSPRLPVLTISAKSEQALRLLVGRYKKYLSGDPQICWADVCFTSNTGRSHFPHRVAAAASSTKEAAERLAAFERTGAAGVVFRSASDAAALSKVAFLCTGQGAQYIGMGRGLFAIEPVFRQAIERCDGILREQLDRSLISVLYPDNETSSPIDETGYTQPVLFAFEYAMSELWRSWGVVPNLLLGHSLGEYVAACAAGVFSLEDALKLVAARGRLMQALPRGGAMAAVYASEEQVKEALSSCCDRVSIAALNAPGNVVISGDETFVSSLLASLERQGVEAKRLSVSHAFHSPLIEPMLDAFERIAEQVTYSRPELPIISNVTGARVDPAEITTAAYWRRHVRSTVRFADGVAAAAKSAQVFIELGPTPTLIGMARECLPETEYVWVPSCRRSVEDCRQIAEALAMSYVAGVNVDWNKVHGSSPRRRVLIPTYAFDRARHWVTARPGRSRPVSRGMNGEAIHPFFDVHVVVAQERDTHLFEGEFSTERFPFLADHRVQGRIVFPGAAYAELALAAKRVAFGRSPVALEDMEYESPILLDEGKRVRIQVRLQKTRDATFKFTIFSHGLDEKSDGTWTSHTSGTLRSIAAPAQSRLSPGEFESIQARCRQEVDGAEFYRKVAERGNQWGPTFQGLERIWRGDREVLGLISVPDTVRAEMELYEWHPAVADCSGQSLAGTIALERTEDARGGAMVGGRIDQISLYAPLRGNRFWVHGRLRHDESTVSNVIVADLRLFDEALNFMSDVRGVHLWYLEESSFLMRAREWMYAVQFQPVDDAAANTDSVAESRRWLILSDRQGVGEALGRALQAKGDRVDFLTPTQHAQSSRGNGLAAPDALSVSAAFASRDEGEAGYDGVVHLCALDAQLKEESSAGDVQSALATGAESVLLCMKELAASSEANPTRLWVVTRGANTVGADEAPADPAHAAIWGLARTFAAEYPSMWGGIVDLSSRVPTDEPTSLAEILRKPGREDQIALRDGKRLAARLARAPLSPYARGLKCRPDVSYVITGGLGGIALGLAAWLVRQGARHLALIGRTPLPPREQWDATDAQSRAGRRIAAVRRLEEMGARVKVGCADVGNEDSLAACLADLFQDGWPEVGGVIHAAAVMSYQGLREATLDNLRDTLHAKALGGWLIHKWATGKPLDFFVLFSSSAAMIHFPFVGAYAAANAFLDGLAHRRAKQAVPAVSINWGLWAAEGMAEDISRRELEILQARGMNSIPADIGFEVLGLLTQHKNPQLGVIPVDWEKWKRGSPGSARIPFFERLMGSTPGESGAGEPDLRAAISAASGEERNRLIRQAVRKNIATVLGLLESELDEGTSMSRMGLDSLMATELRNRLVADTGCSLPLVRLLEGPSVAELVALLEKELNTAAPSTPTATVQPLEAGRMLDDLAGLSDEQVDALLQEMLREKETTS